MYVVASQILEARAVAQLEHFLCMEKFQVPSPGRAGRDLCLKLLRAAASQWIILS